MAAGLIYGSLEPEYQTLVGGSVDAADMWNRLNQEHPQVAAANSINSKNCSVHHES